ncbi:MAG: tryptophan 7-halogenase, partial [Planctomycetota bacterium]|nr:tryptophan 7-halogenase [Planctomycetota bacterium]
MKRESFDCVVLGAGPAGTAAAALVADAGFRTLLVERDAMPRFHVGESLMPETYWPLKRLGVLERLKTSRHTPKHSVQFINHRGQ